MSGKITEAQLDRDNNIRLTLGIPTQDFASIANSKTKFAVQYT